MAVFSGNVQVTLKTTSTGNLAAKTGADAKAVEGLKNQVAQTGDASTATGGKVKGLADQVGQLKGGMKPLNALREGFEQLRSNAGFVVGTILSVGAALVALVEKLRDAHTAQGQLNRRMDEFRAAGNKLQEATDALRDRLGQTRDTFRDTWDAGLVAASDARLQLQLTNDALAESSIKTLVLEQRWKDYQKAGVSVWELPVGFAAQLEDAQKKQLKLLDDRKRLTKEIVDFEKLNLEYLKQQSVEIGKQVFARAIPLAGLAMTVSKTAASGGYSGGGGGGTPAPPRGGGGETAEEFWSAKVAAARGDRPSSRRKTAAQVESLDASLRRRAMALPENADLVKQAGLDFDKKMAEERKNRDSADRLSMGDDIRDFTAALSEALPGMAEFQSALSTISDTWAKWGQGSITTKNAVVGSLGAIAKAGAAQIKNERLRAGVLSIIELGLGFGAIASQNYPAAAAHFTAAAILGTQAAFSASGGGGRGSGAGSSRTVARQVAHSGSGASAPYVININAPWFGPSPQEAAAGLVQFLQRPHGTGFERGRDAA